MAAVDLGAAWQVAMRAGSFEEAWRISDEVLAHRRRQAVDCCQWPRHHQFLYDGSPLERRRVLVRFYQGLGDAIMVSRFLPLLRSRARSVIAFIPTPLIELVRRVGGVDRFVPLHDGAPEVSVDVEIESLELLHALRITASDLARTVPYLSAASPTGRDQSSLRVGLCWRSGGWNPRRSIPAEILTPLRSVGQRISWVSLQYPHETAPLPLEPLPAASLPALAARIAGLDLVISVDTMVAHLAGAMGVRTWTLLPSPCDWRWGDADRTPWYPTMRLWQRADSQGWRPAIDGLRTALAEMAHDLH